MPKKSIMGQFDSEREQAPKLTPAQAIKCKSHGCPLNGSVSELGESWYCSYHAKAGGTAAPKVTKMLMENARLTQIEKTVNKLRADEYDKLIETGEVELHELMKPVEGELHAQWQHRVRQMIHKTFMKKTEEIIEQDELDRQKSSKGISRAFRDLTSGILRPQQRLSK